MIKFLSFLCFVLLSSSAYGQEEQQDTLSTVKAPITDLSKLKHTKSGRIDKIIDGLTIILKDGTIVRLVSLEIPDFHIWEDALYSVTAMEMLKQKLPERTEVMLYQTRDAKKGRVNRMNHQLAHLVVKKDKTWIQGALLSNGLARVYTAPSRADMLTQMYKAEEGARKDKRGIWEKDSPHLVLTPEQTQERIGDLVVVEGVVKKAASIRNKLYLNFGADWKTDFTIQVSTSLRKKFAREGVNLMGLSQQKIRVRGYLREYNGPLIELEDTAHLEVL